MGTICAIYNGGEYSAGIKLDGSIVLRSSDDSDQSKGFNIKMDR